LRVRAHINIVFSNLQSKYHPELITLPPSPVKL
jgi:hypothetical protein